MSVCGSPAVSRNPTLSYAAGPAPKDIGLTRAYASLEALQHLLGRGDGLDLAAADAYAVGATLFQLATGELPAHVAVDRQQDSSAALELWEACLLQKVRALQKQRPASLIC